MLPSRGVLRSLPSARATSSISSQSISRSSRRFGDARNFGTSLRSSGSAAPWSALRAANSRLGGIAGSVAIGGSIETRRALSLWNSSKPDAAAAPVPAPEAATAVSPTPTAEAVVAPASTPTQVPPVETTAAAATEPYAAIVEPTATLADAVPDIHAASILDLPEQIGYLKTLGLDFGWGPSSLMQWSLEHIHVYSGMPWWGSIAATAILLRLALLKPIIKAQVTSAKMQVLQKNPKYEALRTASLEATTRGDRMQMVELRRDISEMNKAAGVNPLNGLWGLLQIPFGYGMFRVLNGASTIPVPGMETGGLLWVTDLTAPDPFYVLPIFGPIAMFAMMKIAGKHSTAQQQAQQSLMMYFIGPISVLVTLYLPAAVQFYFLMTGAIGVVQNWLFNQPVLRRRFGLPEHIPAAKPKADATGTYQPPRAGSENDGSIKGVFASIKQTVHKAKGGAGDYLEAAQKKKADEDAAEQRARLAERQKREYWRAVRGRK
ncbi:Mitochondrial inner membrane protein OXA1 [Colletotrichum trifolii]|uniref:Mitochondrial inner membrane protein OXA1 n=1 Tax=Colletotrichum trifolii TaxID=5466 RepID=A0A4V6QEZ5_COLTR|nr:Mitochondrial inner membrane protein OXA1 [Colletotrichum trifolii]